MRVFFLTKEWAALERLVRGSASQPEGMPSVYIPWLRYKARGYDVHVFMVGDFPAPALVDWQGCTIHLVPEAKLGVFHRLLHGAADNVWLYRAAAAYGRRHRPDVVYALREGPAYAAWALARKFASVCVKRIYGTWLYEHWFLRRSLRMRLRCLRLFACWLWPCDLIVITNDGTGGDKVADFLRIPRSRYRFWLNGVVKDWVGREQDSSALRSQIGLAEGDRMVLTLGRIAHWKRHDRAVGALPQILASVPSARLVIAGDGPLRGEVEALAEQLGVRDRVIFLGMVEHERVRELMSATDVFLLPYDLTCLCNTLLEAQICGAPTVTWDVGDTRDIVPDRVHGRLLPNAEPQTLAQAVVELLQDERARRALADGARRLAAEKLQSWDQRMDTEIDLVERIGRRRAGRWAHGPAGGPGA